MNFRRSIIIAELWRPEVARRWKNSISYIFWKNDPYWKILEILFPKNSLQHDVLCSNFMKFGWRKSVKSCVRCTLESDSNARLQPIASSQIKAVHLWLIRTYGYTYDRMKCRRTLFMYFIQHTLFPKRGRSGRSRSTDRAGPHFTGSMLISNSSSVRDVQGRHAHGLPIPLIDPPALGFRILA